MAIIPGVDYSCVELLSPSPLQALAGVLDVAVPHEVLVPPLWHWVYLLDRPRQDLLGPDGHPRGGIPAPPGPGRRRMFAGGRVVTHRPLTIGLPATKTVELARTVEKEGRSGTLTFVTVRYVFSQEGEVAIEEEQDIVYRGPHSGPTTGRRRSPDVGTATGPHLVLDVDPVLLFRFSALTYNAHRIHYDQAYAREEGYGDLVVHGPLQALLMAELFRRNGVQVLGREFAYRLISPLIGPQRLTVSATTEDLSAGVQVSGAGSFASAHGWLSEPDRRDTGG